jgi:hypothetical protein
MERQSVQRFASNLLRTLTTGYVLFYYSERVFWTVWRDVDVPLDTVLTWLAYSAVAYLFLAIVHWSRADDIWSVFLCGAIFGWLVEGGIIYTLYGTESSAPFPLSISVTGLSWHALISVIVGWWATKCALLKKSASAMAGLSVAIGVFWGIWAMVLWRETPPVKTTAISFFLNSACLTAGLIFCWWLSTRRWLAPFRPAWLGSLFCLGVVLLFYAQHVQSLGIRPLIVLPLVLSVAAIPLYIRRRSRQVRETRVHAVADVTMRRLAILGTIPCIATSTYTVAVGVGLERLPVNNFIYYWLTAPVGFLMFVVAVALCLGRARLPAARTS